MIEQHILDNRNITANSEQLAILKRNFPNCFDKEGNFLIDSLTNILKSNGVATSHEGYSLNWLGKSYARLLANEKPRTFIRPNKEHNFKEQNQNSNNLLIKGDNLEVLKHLKNAYAEAVKVIYIDPPYNTGSDGFVYQDDRKFTKEELAHLANVSEEEAKRILDFTDRGSNSHSAWLTFMYPRLYVARELLREDGVIFISIDDNEQAQLKLLCDEVFGEENFVEIFSWIKTATPPALSNKSRKTIEFVLCYEKNKTALKYNGEKLDGGTQPLLNSGNSLRTLVFPKKAIKFNTKHFKDGELKSFRAEKVSLLNNIFLHNGEPDVDVVLNGEFKWVQSTLDEEVSLGTTFIINSDLLSVRFLRKEDGFKRPTNFIKDRIIFPLLDKPNNKVDTNEEAGKEIIRLFQTKVFDYPKPISLIKYLISFIETKDGIILDFFAGSGTTAHAVMELNKDNKESRLQYIQIQLPEELSRKTESGKNAVQYCIENSLEQTIFEITKARIEKAAETIKADHPDYEGDLGFKIFETIPLPEHYDKEIEELSAETQMDIWDGSDADESLLEAILTTWTLFDRILLTTDLEIVMLDDYKAFYGKGKESNTLYLIYKGFRTDHIKMIIDRLENDNEFTPRKIVIYGHNFDTKSQRELSEAMNSFRNKKSIEIDLIKRY